MSLQAAKVWGGEDTLHSLPSKNAHAEDNKQLVDAGYSSAWHGRTLDFDCMTGTKPEGYEWMPNFKVGM